MGQLENLMKLGMSEAEAREVLAADKAIDRGEKMPFDLPKDKEKATRQYRQADRAKPFIPDLKPRERKPNEDKRFLIGALVWALTTDIEQEGDNVNADDVVVTNPERQIDFTYSGTRYRIVLSAPRK